MKELVYYKVTEGYIYQYRGNGYCSRTENEMNSKIQELLKKDNYKYGLPQYFGYGRVCVNEQKELVSIDIKQEDGIYRRVIG